MHPILLSILLGLTAAAANVFGGAIIVQKNWKREYLKYFVALGAGFMLATAIVELFPASLELQGKSAAFLVLIGYLIIHFFEHTVTPHFHFGEETHADEFVHSHTGYSVLIGLTDPHLLRRHRYRFRLYCFQLAGLDCVSGGVPAQNSGGIHCRISHARRRTKQKGGLGSIGATGRSNFGGSTDNGAVPPSSVVWIAVVGRRHDLRGRLRPDAGSQSRTRSPHGAGRFPGCRTSISARPPGPRSLITRRCSSRSSLRG